VITAVRKALRYMTRGERAKFSGFLILRSLVAIFDLTGIIAIGFLAASIALFLSQGSDPTRLIELGPLSIPAINAQNLPWVTITILALFVSKAIASIFLTRQLAYFLAKIEARASRDVAERAFGGGLDKVRENSRDEILFAVMSGSPSAFNSLLNSIGTLAAEGFLFILVLLSFFILDPWMALGAVLYFGLIGVLIQHFLGRQLERTSERINKQSIISSSSLLDLSDVYREATVLGKSQFFINKLHSSRLASSGSTANQLVLLGMPRYVIETSLIIAVALFVLVQSLSGDISFIAVSLGIFLSGGLRLTAALLPLQSALLTIKSSVPGANRAFGFLERSDGNLTKVSAFRIPVSLGQDPSLEFKRVFYSYPKSENDTLSNLTLSVPMGTQAAIIGVSGSGKSTIADLVLGLIEPTKGEVLIGGVPTRAILETTPGVLGYVPQSPGLVSGTIAQNIALGVERESLDLPRLEKAIDDAHLSDFIGELPEGIHTDLGKRKDELSGGQLQRIGLARALYTTPKILVMDEATSALDAESENEINKAIDDMRGRVTVILIAHRLNTVQNSDMVFLMERGSLTASGTFHHLLETNTTVQNFARLMAVGQVD
jgi:ABC-type multidrug transport system fused ATPase/permease subunit